MSLFFKKTNFAILREKYVKLSHINLSWKPNFKETRGILIFVYDPIISSFMSLYNICPDNLKKLTS